MVKMLFKLRKVMPLCLLLVLLVTPVAHAAEIQTVSDQSTAETSWLDRAKDAAANAYGKVKEKAPEAWDKTKEVAGEAYDAAKEKAPEVWDKTKEIVGDAADAAKDGLHSAQEGISEWNQGQQDQFWDWVDDMQSGQTSIDNDAGSPSASEQQPPENQAPSTPDKSATAPSDKGEQPAEKDPTVVQGDGYVVVDGERYELAERDEAPSASDEDEEQSPNSFWSRLLDLFLRDLQSRTDLVVILMPIFILILVIGLIYHFIRNRKK